MSGRIARIAWAGTLLLAAFLVFAIQLDRQTHDTPQLAVLVPSPLRGQAQEALTQARLAAADGAAARADARVLISRRPLPAGHLLLYSQAALLEDDGEAAISALEIAATRGWREPAVQLAVAEAALRSGAADVAADRMAALLALGVRAPSVDALVPRLLDQPQGRAAVAARLGDAGYWQASFLRQASQLAAPADFADTIRRARAAGVQPDCRPLQAAMALFQRQGAIAEAATLAAPDCPAV